jgi:lipooligosaccharide transport system ATP-binding protein
VTTAVVSEPVRPIIEARGLRKAFGERVAVDGLSFTVRRGECLGFLGPNGAGKTTTIRMLSAQVPMDAGEIVVDGLGVDRRPRTVKTRLGICPQEDNLDADFTVRANLLLYASYYGLPRRRAAERADQLLRFVNLQERRDSAIGELSGGMKRRLLLARSLINEPPILVLDEPTTGLDPQARHQVWGAVDELRAGGTTILLTTHYMDEAERLCDRLLILDEGRIVAEGAPGPLIAEIVGAHVVEAWGDPDRLEVLRASFSGRWEIAGRRLYLYPGDSTAVQELMVKAEQTGGFERVLHRPATLEDVFLRLTGRELRE